MSWIQGTFRRGGSDRARGIAKPTARTEDLIVEQLQDEILVYDQTNDLAHCLSPTAARVWQACDGATSVDKLGAALALDSATLERALEELDGAGLLVSATTSTSGSTRRELAARAAKVGAAVTAAPLVLSILAPTPALAASQAFCLALGCAQDCGTCHQAHCSCCGPGNSTTSADKICTADCSSTFCSDTIRAAHCGTVSPSNACN